MFLTDPNDRNRLIYVAAFALLVRSLIAWTGWDSFQNDPDAYRIIAETLSETGVYGLPGTNLSGELSARPTAFRPPLYPFILSWLTGGGDLSLLAVAVLHITLGLAAVLFSTLTCSCLLEQGRVGRASTLAGFLVSIDPILIHQSTLIMTETIATTLSMMIIWFWARSASAGMTLTHAAVLGILLALAYLCRPPFLVWAFLLVLVIPFTTDRNWAIRLGYSTILVAILGLAVLAWTTRNAKSVGHPVWATTHGGYTLLLANNPSFYDYLQDGPAFEAWDAKPFLNAYLHRYDGDPNTAEFWQREWPAVRARGHSETHRDLAGITEHQDDQRCYHAARATINRRPGMFVWSCIVRCARLWSPIPHHTPGRSWIGIGVVGAFYCVIFVAALVSLWRFRNRIFRREWWAIWAFVFTLSAVHAVYWSNIRMRAPLIPAVTVIACGLFVRSSQGTENVVDH